MKSISILKHNLMRAAMTLALIVTCATAWAQNPNLADYTFTTGQDASKWITLSDNATQMIGSGVDDAPSALTSIGFDFPFGDGTYSQFWTNPNGIFSFNSSPANSYKWQFHSDGNQYQANQPKICGISADMSTGNNGYVKYEMTGTAPNRVFVCEFFLRGWTSTTTPANIKWQVHLHEANAKVVMVYGVSDPNLNSNQIGLSQSGSDIWTINPSTHEATHSTGAVTSTNPVNTWPGTYRYYEFNPPVPSDFTDNGDGTYTIYTAAGWDLFCDALLDKDTYNGFSGKTVYLANDIEVSRMAGSSYHDFAGTFDGQNNTLTFNYTTTESTERVAPFSYITNNAPEGSTTLSPAVIRNLNVVSNITTNGQYAGGMVGEAWGELTIEHCTVSGTITTSNQFAGGIIGRVSSTPLNITDCRSSVTIISSINGDGTHGGIAARVASSTTVALNISGCLFNGKIVTTNGTTHCGGFVGHNDHSNGANVSISNSLYAPASDANTVSAGCATFVRDAATITNCYYTEALGTAQGKQAHSITAGENIVTLANAGTPTPYNTSGITSYGTGIKYNNVLYAGENDQVSLTLNHSEAPTGYTFTGYTANAGTLNGTTLTMPNEAVTISATMTANTYTVQFVGNGNTGGSMSDQTFTYDVAQNLTANAFTRTGFAFTEWNTQANGGGTSYTDGQEVINLTATNNGTVTLYAQWTLAVVPVTYLDMNGTQQQCNSYILLTGNETEPLTAGWYVADGNVTFSNTINVAYGNVHIILKDNAVMNVGAEQSPISEKGIYVYNNKSLNIYAQSTGVDK